VVTLSRGGRRKNDRIDAAAAVCVAVLQGDARPVDPEGPTDILALLDERRTNMSNSRTRLVNELHALLRQLFAGGAPTSLSAARPPPCCGASVPAARSSELASACAEI